jgi:hypothetical protein
MPSAIDLENRAGITLLFEVEDETCAPLAGARVLVIHHGWSAGFCGFPVSESDEAITGADGRMRISGLAAPLPYGERYVVSITHPDFAEALVYRPDEAPREGDTATIRVRMEHGHTLAGEVRGLPEGQLAEVMAVLADREVPGCHAVVCRAVSDERGRILLTGLRAGEHELIPSVGGARHPVVRARVPGEEPVVFTLARGRSVSGTVIDEAGAVAGALVTAQWSGPRSLRDATTDAEGRFTIPGLPLDDALVIVATRMENNESLGLSTIPAGEADAAVVLDARERGAWRGVVVDAETGEPVAREVVVTAQPAGTDGVVFAGGPGAEGRFELRLAPGRYEVVFAGWMPDVDADYHALLRGVEIGAREVREDVRVTAERAFSVPVHVLDADTGEPIAGAAVTALPPRIWSRIWLGNTDEHGTMRIEPAFACACRVWADAPDHARAATEVTLARGMDPVVLRLARRGC